jgi:hypothetical protein
MDNKTLISWSIFLTISAILVVGGYFIFKNSAIGKLFGDIFGILDAAAAAMDAKFKECEDSGFFSIKCGLGIAAIIAGILAALLIGIKWLLGPAGDTKAGELWRSIKGKGVTSQDIQTLNDRVEAEIASIQEKNPSEWKDIQDVPGGELLAGRLIAAKETYKETIKDLKPNDPTYQAKLQTAQDNLSTAKASAKSNFVENSDEDSDTAEQQFDDINSFIGE